MAESGRKGDNPFSFKKFVNKKEPQQDDNGIKSNDGDIDIFDIPDTTKPRKREKPKQIIVVDEEVPKGKQKKKGKSENPFSFKKFLAGPSSDVKASANSNTAIPGETARKPRSDEQRVSSSGDLPDFVQDHYTEASKETANLSLSKDSLNQHTMSPDIGDRNFPNIDTVSIDSKLSHSDNDNDFSDGDDKIMTGQSSGGNMLPDFLSDAAIGNHTNVDSVRNVFDSGGDDFAVVDGDVNSKLRKVLDENAKLKRQIEEMKFQTVQDKDSLAVLQRQYVLQKKKEEEDTAVMERAMEQVEKNLSDSTTRAVQAETTVTKLKQEVKSLQAEVKVLRAENSMLQAGDQYVLDIKERTTYVADQLSTATKTAETSLRQMLAGVENLKLMSKVLISIDKITEEKPNSNRQQEMPKDGT